MFTTIWSTTEAIEFLNKNAFRLDQCPICKRNSGYKKEAIGTYGMVDELTLYRYTLLDGSTADEFVQDEIWDSGPMIWLGLRWKDSEFRWADKEIEDNDNELPDYGLSEEGNYYTEQEDLRRRNENK
jgi:hypothetical protein